MRRSFTSRKCYKAVEGGIFHLGTLSNVDVCNFAQAEHGSGIAPPSSNLTPSPQLNSDPPQNHPRQQLNPTPLPPVTTHSHFPSNMTQHVYQAHQRRQNFSDRDYVNITDEPQARQPLQTTHGYINLSLDSTINFPRAFSQPTPTAELKGY